MDHYILVDRKPVKIAVWGEDGQCNVALLAKFGEWFEKLENRSIGKTDVGPFNISTIFLGFDHSWNGGEPVLFETMVFDHSDKHYSEVFKRPFADDLGKLTRRHHTIEEAEAYHARTVKVIERLMRLTQRGIPTDDHSSPTSND